MNDRKRLMGLLSRNLPAVPSVLADTILRSKWLTEYTEAVRAEEREKAEQERDAANARADALVRENLALAQERDEARAAIERARAVVVEVGGDGWTVLHRILSEHSHPGALDAVKAEAVREAAIALGRYKPIESASSVRFLIGFAGGAGLGSGHPVQGNPLTLHAITTRTGRRRGEPEDRCATR